MASSVTGMMIYYHEVCDRKLWYFSHEIFMEQENENVQIGRLLDESSYAREDKHIQIDDTICVDFIREKRILHEIKKSPKMEQASVWQLKYYLYYLKERGVKGLSGQIDYPLLKQTIKTTLSKEDEDTLQNKIEIIQRIVNMVLPPLVIDSAICKSCAYHDLCYI